LKKERELQKPFLSKTFYKLKEMGNFQNENIIFQANKNNHPS